MSNISLGHAVLIWLVYKGYFEMMQSISLVDSFAQWKETMKEQIKKN